MCDRKNDDNIIDHSVHEGIRETDDDLASDLAQDHGRRFGILEIWSTALWTSTMNEAATRLDRC